jgi:hypothetical protein
VVWIRLHTAISAVLSEAWRVRQQPAATGSRRCLCSRLHWRELAFNPPRESATVALLEFRLSPIIWRDLAATVCRLASTLRNRRAAIDPVIRGDFGASGNIVPRNIIGGVRTTRQVNRIRRAAVVDVVVKCLWRDQIDVVAEGFLVIHGGVDLHPPRLPIRSRKYQAAGHKDEQLPCRNRLRGERTNPVNGRLPQDKPPVEPHADRFTLVVHQVPSRRWWVYAVADSVRPAA